MYYLLFHCFDVLARSTEVCSHAWLIVHRPPPYLHSVHRARFLVACSLVHIAGAVLLTHIQNEKLINGLRPTLESNTISVPEKNFPSVEAMKEFI